VLAIIALNSARASSIDIACWAPSRDKSVEFFASESVPPAIVLKDDWGWNCVLAPIVRGEHINGGALLGSRRAVPFRFRHSPTSPGWFEATCSAAVAAHLHGTGGTGGNGSPAAKPKANKLAAGSAVKRFGLTLGYQPEACADALWLHSRGFRARAVIASPYVLMRRLAGMLQRHCVEPVQELVDIDKFLVSVRG